MCRKLTQISLLPYLSEGCGARGHEDLPHSVVKPLHGLIIHTQEALSCALLGHLESTDPSVPFWEPLSNPWKPHPGTTLPAHLILQVPDPVLVGELLVAGAALGQDAALEAAHVEQQVGVVLAVHGHEAVLPLHRGHRAGQTVLDVPEHSTATAKQHGHSDTAEFTQITTGRVLRASLIFQCRPLTSHISS